MKIDFKASRGGRLERLVRERLPYVRRAFLQKLFRKREIKVGDTARRSDADVSAGEKITVFLPDSRKNFRIITGCEILFENGEVIAFDKAAGVTTHKGIGTKGKTLRESAEELLELNLRVVHRLDRDTSGVLIFAKTKKACEKIAEEFRQRRTDKTYHAVIVGIPKEKSGIITFPLKKVDERIVVAKSGGLSAETHWKLIKKLKDSALVEVKLITGRTHQIRVHFQALGHPIVGDKLYNDTDSKDRMMLHASQLKILDYTFEAKLPFVIPAKNPRSDKIIPLS
jgi:RluA family pseudouridine synthase